MNGDDAEPAAVVPKKVIERREIPQCKTRARYPSSTERRTRLKGALWRSSTGRGRGLRRLRAGKRTVTTGDVARVPVVTTRGKERWIRVEDLLSGEGGFQCCFFGFPATMARSFYGLIMCPQKIIDL